MSEQEKKKGNEVTREGAVEVDEEDLEQASGGAGYLKLPAGQTLNKQALNLRSSSLKYGAGPHVSPENKID